MIKLIATDMDGTLLDGNNKLPKDFFTTLDKLKDRGVKFIVASGRSYHTLYENFKPISEDLYYICDNGAYIVENSGKSQISIIDKSNVRAIIKECANLSGIQLILCGIKGAYLTACNNENFKEIGKYYISKHIVEDLFTVDDDIFKIAICDTNNVLNSTYPILNSLFSNELRVVVSGEFWVDITNKTINKGFALEQIQRAENITYEETMVFGDFYNDIEMLKKAHYSFVMENANEDMKKYGNYIASSNRENGVIKAIEEYVLNTTK